MKLRMICENIRRTEFYDFYALAYVYQELQTSTGVDPAYKKEVEYTLRDLAEYILTDHISQLTIEVAGRLINNIDHQDVCNQYRIPIPDKDGLNEEQFKDSIRKLSLTQQAKFLREISSSRTQGQIAAGMDGIWHKHATTVARLANTNTNDTNALVLAIDYIYGMTHHGGQITDHFDERDWLEAALNTRALTSPKNLLFHASSHIRELLTSASIGIPRHEKVPLLQELEVMLTRANQKADWFDYSYKIESFISHETGEKIDYFVFSLKMRLAMEEKKRKFGESDKYQLISWNDYHYREWGELYNHDYSQDKECAQTIIGVLKTQKILLFDKNGQKISKKPNTWHRELGEITTPQGPIRSTYNSPKTPSVARIARDLIDSVLHYQEINEIDWQPIQGDPNPPQQ